MLKTQPDRQVFLWGFEEGELALMADISLRDYFRFVLGWD